MPDPRYQHGVGGLPTGEVAERLRDSIRLVGQIWPDGVGVTLLVFDMVHDAPKVGVFDSRGIAYISSAQRQDMVKAMREWLDKQTRQS